MSDRQPKTFAEKIKAAREALGLSQSGAAKKWGLNVRTLQGWEQGRSSPTGLYLERIESILKKVR